MADIEQENTGVKSTIGSVAGTEADRKSSAYGTAENAEATSEPGNIDTAERDSGPAVDPTTDKPLDSDGGLDPNAQVTDPKLVDDGKAPDTESGEGTIQPPPEGLASTDEANAADTATGDIEDEIDPDPNGTEAPEGEVRSIVNQFKGRATTNDGTIVVPAEDGNATDEELAGEVPMHNAAGHRCAFINRKGDMSIMDDETAQMFYDEPAFYSYVYDPSVGDRVHVSTLQWADVHGKPIGGFIGHAYELNQ